MVRNTSTGDGGEWIWSWFFFGELDYWVQFLFDSSLVQVDREGGGRTRRRRRRKTTRRAVRDTCDESDSREQCFNV